MKRVTIIGAGIAGLSAAYYLQRQGGDTFEITVLEASDRLGGKILTDHINGFNIEGGPDSFVTDKPAGLRLCHDLGLGDQLIPSNQTQRNVYVWQRNRLIQFPGGFRLTIPSEVWPFLKTPLISPLGKMRMGLDFILPRKTTLHDESLASFIRRRFGQECLAKIAGPMMAGIYVSDPERMSILGTFPRFAQMERDHGSLIKAARAGRKRPHPVNPLAASGAIFNSIRGGLDGMVQALRDQIRGEIRLNAPALSLERSNARWRIATPQGAIESEHVICAAPAWQAADLLRPLDAGLATKLDAIRFVSTATVSFGYLRSEIPSTCRLDGYGVMIPRNEKRDLMACTWSSVKFRHRAPEDSVLLRAFVGGPGAEEKALLSDDALVNLVRREYETMFGIQHDPIISRVFRWARGNPQYDVGHLDRVSEMESRAAASLPGLHLIGSSYRGIGIPDCIAGAVRAVNTLLGRPADK